MHEGQSTHLLQAKISSGIIRLHISTQCAEHLKNEAELIHGTVSHSRVLCGYCNNNWLTAIDILHSGRVGFGRGIPSKDAY